MSNSDAGRNARLLIRRTRTASLATLMAEGGPYASLVNVASDMAGRPLLLISRLAWHTRNLLNDGRASLLFAEATTGGADPLTQARVSVQGRMQQLEGGEAAARYLARHPAASFYAGFADFAFWRMEPERVHLVAGFGKIESFAAVEVFLAPADCAALAATVPSALVHMAEDHAEALRLSATRLLGAEDGAWQMTAIDPDGAELQLGQSVIRLEFPELVLNSGQLRAALAALARRAREAL